MMSDRCTIMLLSLMCLALWGCATAPHTDEHHHDAKGPSLQFYETSDADPAWLARAASFHGHLGPWVTVGALIGGDAVRHLDTLGHWEIEVICWMPPDKQKQPFSCILDGLQASSGATMGKRNIRFDYSPDIVIDDQPVVYVIRRAKGDRPASGLVYRLRPMLVDKLAHIDPTRLEELSRRIAKHSIAELFEESDLTAEQIDKIESQHTGTDHKH